jgi:two-component system sensor kinase FixL
VTDETNEIHIGNVTLSFDEAKETLCAIREGKIDAVVVEGVAGQEVYTFRDPSHPFRLLVEAMNEGAALATLDGTLCYENPRFRAMAGGEAPPRSLAELVTPEGQDALAALLDRARDGAARGNVELIGDSTPVPVLLSVSHAKLVDVELLCVVATDLTEQKRQEDLYRAARQEIEARDRLFSVAAHELRNPLATLELRTEMLGKLLAKREAPVPAEVAAQTIEKMRDQIKRLGALLAKLLDVGTIGGGRMRLSREAVDLAGVVREVVERSSDELTGSGSELSLELEPVSGRWDRVRIEQVVQNLLSNAAKYGLGGPIRIRVESRGDEARLVVEDAGRGIPPEARDRIFRPYERLADSAGIPGLGIGLFITSEIVKAHGGSIRVEEGHGGGSRFSVDLPRQDPTLH